MEIENGADPCARAVRPRPAALFGMLILLFGIGTAVSSGFVVATRLLGFLS